MAGAKPKICVAIVNDNMAAVKRVEPLTDLFEVRIDLIGEGWQDVAGQLGKPWLATNRRKEEGGNWQWSEAERIDELLKALDLGASIIDIELRSPDVRAVVEKVKGRAECLVSYHDFEKTPPPDELRYIILRQQDAGADICKLVTTARAFSDNLAVLRLIKDFPEIKVVSFAMGEAGRISRVLSPLAGGYFTFASAETGNESAPGQVTAEEIHDLYRLMGYDK
ncbi:MAG: type I 3-dehydroquinate dehydratase [Dehalococcoidales bacterium]|nr:type I 3-dehydroquinate dehydratase [Dehalococcoidales bacterium]